MQGYRSEWPANEFPPMQPQALGRVLSVACTQDVVWVAAQHEEAGRNRIVIVRRQDDRCGQWILDAGGYAHGPAVSANGGGDGVDVVWNEAVDGGWAVRRQSVAQTGRTDGAPETVSAGSSLILPPAAAHDGRALWMAWPERQGKRMRIQLLCLPGRAPAPVAVSPQACDAFRPSLAASGDGVFLAWDQYRNRRYEVVLARADRSGCRVLWTGHGDNERWFCPRVVAAADGTAYLTWAVLREVEDPALGIVDHFPFAMAARVRGGRAALLPDARHAEDSRVVADLREGLLGSVTYRGYNGLRRRPQLAVDEDGRPWCLWELRMEDSGGGKLSGRLAGRKLCADGSWGQPCFLHGDAHAYGVAPAVQDGRIAVGCIGSAMTFPPDLEAVRIPLTAAEPYTVRPARWKRWRPAELAPPRKPEQRVAVNGRACRLFWADTHCHSNFSPDAEGEVDELIHFARDVAGLDAVCIVDNDYYPHKALTEAEWRIHQEMARHFTRAGRFVVFPGYEFTFHRRDLEPNFNHRYVLYPGPGGRLLRRIDPGSETDGGLLASEKGLPALLVPHHCTWQLLDAKQEPGVEVCSSWRVCLEETDFALSQLRQGRKFGFIGSSDTHRALPGLGGALTGLFAPELTPDSLFDAYRHRRCIATQGFLAMIDFRVGGAFIGGETETDGPPLVSAQIAAPDRIESVRIVRDGDTVHEIRPGSDRTELEFRDASATPGPHFYFLRLKLEGDPSFNIEGDPSRNAKTAFSLESRYPHNFARARGVLAWTSPVWVTIR